MNNISEHGKIHEYLREWNIPQYSRRYFEKYYLLHWSTPYFIGNRLAYGNVIEHQGENYFIVLHKCSMDEIAICEQVQLSFRKLENKLFGLVLVRPLMQQLNIGFTDE